MTFSAISTVPPYSGRGHPDLTLKSESRDPTLHFGMSPPEEGLSPGRAIPPALETTHSIIAVEYTTAHAATSDTTQDTKPAEQTRAISTLGTAEAME